VAVIHGVLSVLSGGDAKGAFNLLLLSLLLGGLFKLLELVYISRTEKLALATLFITTPLVALTLVGLQTDLFLALMLCTAAVLLVDLLEKFRISTAVAAVFVGSLALSVKLPGLTIAGPVLVGVIYAGLQNKFDKGLSPGMWLKIVSCLLIAAALAFLPYVRAYLFTGNPVFPLYNEIFKSEFFDPINFKDLRWDNGATLSSFYGLFFNSTLFLEADNNFVGGFQYFLLAPIGIAASIFLRIKRLYIIIIMSLLYVFPIFLSLQYLRYFFAALPLLSILIASLYLFGKEDGLYRKWLSATLYVIAFVNFVFMPGICWLFFNSPFAFLSAEKKKQAIWEVMPEQQLNHEINKLKRNATVLFAFDRPFGATLAGSPIYNGWYANAYSKAIKNWNTAEDVRNALKIWNIDYVYWDQKKSYSVADTQQNYLREVLITHGKPILQVGSIIAFSIAKPVLAYQEVFSYSKFTSLDSFKVTGGLPQIDMESIKLSKQDMLTTSVDLSAFTHFKYAVEFSCDTATDAFVAHIDWGNGFRYRKLLGCHEGLVSFAETGLIPTTTKEVEVSLSGRTEQSIKVHKLSLGAN
jgi:hypothetical protein